MMNMEDNTKYITDRIWHKILPPALLCNLFILLVIHFGMFFLVSHFCPKAELVVYSTFLPFWSFFAAVECLFSIAGPQYFSIFKGAGRHPDAQKVFSEVFTTHLLFTVIGSLLAAYLMPHIVRFLGLPPENVPMAVSYGRLLFCCGLSDTMATMLRTFVQSDSLPRTGATVSILHATTLLIGMYVCFCILHSGLMAYYGVFLCCEFLAIGTYLTFFLRRKTTVHLGWRRMRWQSFRTLLSLSCNNIINNGGAFVVALLTTRWLMAAFGPAAVTILALLSMLASCFDAFRKGYISSAQSLLGVYRGEANNNGIRVVCRKGFLSSLYIQVGGALILLCFPEAVGRWMQVLENFPGEAALAIRLFALSILFCHTYCFFTGYYTICGYEKLVLLCSIVGNFLLYFAVTAFFLLVLHDERICWWYYPLAWVIALLFLLVAAWWKKRAGKYGDLLLLPERSSEGKQYHFLLKNQMEDFQDYRVLLGAFLRKNTVSPKNSEQIKHLFEELFLFAGQEIGDRQDALFSIVITVSEQKLELALRYDSRESCLKSALNGKQTALSPEHVAGARILSRLADEIYIDRIYGINYVRLTLHRV